MKRFALAAVLALALGLPSAAVSKEVSELQVCGAQACKSITDRALLEQFEGAAGDADYYAGPARPSAFYVIRVTVDVGPDHPTHTWRAFYVPSAKLMRSVDEHGRASWRRMPQAERKLFDAFAEGVEPYPAPEITRARVGRKAVANPASYLNLYTLKRSPRAFPKRNSWLRIRLESTLPSPWTDGTNRLRYSQKERLLERDGEFVRLSKQVTRALSRAGALRLPPAR